MGIAAHDLLRPPHRWAQHLLSHEEPGGKLHRGLGWPSGDTAQLVEATLPNGLRAIAIGRPGTATVASKLFLKAGSRHDGDRHGIGHCLEHALFRGTVTRSSRELYGAIEDLGGRIQGETVKDYLALSAVTGAQHYRTGLEVLADVLLNPRFDTAAFETEKLVILDEMTRRADMRQIIWDLYDLTTRSSPAAKLIVSSQTPRGRS